MPNAPEYSQNSFVDRRTLIQTNAAIFAGMLIFLTIGNFDISQPILNIIFWLTAIGFSGLILSMILCMYTSPNEFRKQLYFTCAEICFVLGLIFILLTVLLSLQSKMS